MAMSNHQVRPIVIVGCRRSGTTLLSTMLAKHPHLLVHPHEAQFFLELHQRFGKQITDVTTAVAHISQHRYCAEEVTGEMLSQAFGSTSTISLSDFCQKYLELWAGPLLEKHHLVFKHPALVFYLDLVFYLFPEARIIHMVRDPHANISSQRLRWRNATLWECIGWWRDAAQAGHSLAQNRPDLCIELTYEGLVKEPEASLAKLCQFLDIPYSENMTNFDLQKRIYSPGETSKENPVGPSQPDSWKQQLTDLEIALIERECMKEMLWWNYELIHPHVSSISLTARSLQEQLIYSFKTGVRQIKGTNWRG